MTIDSHRLVELAWNQLWQVTLVALVVAVLVKTFGKRRPHLAYLLWLLVIAKCLTPPIWSSPTGVFSWARLETRGSVATVSKHDAIPTPPRSESPANQAVPVLVELEESSHSEAEPTSTRESLVALQVPREEAARGDNAAVITDTTGASPAQVSLAIPWPVALFVTWAIGSVICAITVFAKHVLCALAVWRSSEPADKHLTELLVKLSDKLGIRRDVRLMVTKRPLGPAVFGIFRPTILIPDTLTSFDFARRIEPILAHELIHFRRGDTMLGVLQLAAQILWWFHPLVWWVNREASRERERCCDEEAVAGLAFEPSDYAQTLLDVLRSKRKLEPVFAQPGVRPVDITARRLEHIMQGDRKFFQRTPAWYWLVAGVVAALLLPGGGLVIEAGAANEEGAVADVAIKVNTEWAQYGGSSYRNNVSNDTGLPEKWDVETGENIKWMAPLGDSVYSSPIVSDGKVIIGTNNGAAYGERFPKGTDASCLVCFDADTGRFLWQHANEKLASGRVHDWPMIGICSTSCVEKKRLYYVNNRNELVCLDLDGFHDNENDGPFKDEPATTSDEADVIWQLDIMNQLGVSQHNQAISSVTIAGDLIFAGTSHGLGPDHIQQPKEAPSFIAVNKNTGRVVWQDSSPSGNLVHGQWSSPAYGIIGSVEQVVFAGGDGWIYGFDVKATVRGETKLLWKFDGNPKDSKWVLGGRGTRNNAIAIPMIHNDRVYMTMGQDPEHGEGIGHVWCIDATKRGDISAELVFNKDNPDEPIPHKRLQAAELDKGDIVKSNPNSGLIWKFDQYDTDADGEIDFEETMHRSFSSVVVRDGLAIVPDYSGVIHCLDAETGEPYWHYDMLASVWATPYVADGKIYIGDEDAKVVVFALSKELDVLAMNQLERSQYTTIMSVGGTLFVPSVGKLVAVADPSRVPQRKAKTAKTKSDWPSSRGNPQNTGVGSGGIPNKLEVLWKMRTENECEGTPVVVDGVAYIGDLEDSLYAVDTRTGQQRWVYRNRCGYQASPLVYQGAVYAGDVDGTMHCFDAESGEQLWRFETDATISCSANAVDGLVVFATEDGTIFALAPQTGKLVWKTSAGTQLQSAPAISGKRVVVAGCDHQLYVLDLETGQQLVTTDIEAPSGATPAIRNGLVYFGTEEGVLFCVEVDTGKIRWRFEGKELGQAIRSSAAVTDDLVIVAGRRKNVVAIDIQTGKLVWRYHAKGSFDSSPVVVDDHILIGSSDGRLYVLDKTTGQAKYVYETGEALIGSVAVADGQLLLAGADGSLYCFGKKKTPPAQKPAAASPEDKPAKETPKRTFRVESLDRQPLQVQSSKKDGKEQIEIQGRCRLTLGEGKGAIVAEADQAIIRGAILEEADWESLEFLLSGKATLTVGKSRMAAEKIRYWPAKRQFELEDLGTLQLPDLKATTNSTSSSGINASESAQEVTGTGGKATDQPGSPDLKRFPNAKRTKVQVKFVLPQKMVVDCLAKDDEGGFAGLVAPGRVDLLSAGVYRLKLTKIPEYEGLELYPTLELGPVTPKTDAYLAHNAIPINFTNEDIDQVVGSHFVTKVIYLPDAEFQELAIAGVETLVSTRLDPGIDPIVEADRRGTILAIVRIGNRDLTER